MRYTHPVTIDLPLLSSHHLNANATRLALMAPVYDRSMAQSSSARARHSTGSIPARSPAPCRRSHKKENWTYALGFCKDVQQETIDELSQGRCSETKGSAGELMDGPAPAFQMLDTEWGFHSCYRLGSSVGGGGSSNGDDAVAGEAADASTSWGLIDPMEPASGIYLHYKVRACGVRRALCHLSRRVASGRVVVGGFVAALVRSAAVVGSGGGDFLRARAAVAGVAGSRGCSDGATPAGATAGALDERRCSARRCGCLTSLLPAAPLRLSRLFCQGGNACTDSISDKEECTDEINGKDYCRRSLRVNLVCNNHVTEVPMMEQVQEERGCVYSVTLNSQYGCPVECPRGESALARAHGEAGDGEVCLNRGVCVYEGIEDGEREDGSAAGSAACMCEEGWGGRGCALELAAPGTLKYYFHSPAGQFEMSMWGLMAGGMVTMAYWMGIRRHQLTALASGVYHLMVDGRKSAEMTGRAGGPTFQATTGVYADGGRGEEHGRFLAMDEDEGSQEFSL